MAQVLLQLLIKMSMGKQLVLQLQAHRALQEIQRPLIEMCTDKPLVLQLQVHLVLQEIQQLFIRMNMVELLAPQQHLIGNINTMKYEKTDCYLVCLNKH